MENRRKAHSRPLYSGKRGIQVGEQTPSPHSNAQAEFVEVVVPARPEYVAVVRLAAAGIAGRMSFSVDDIEDIKIAVGEACNAATIAAGPRVHVRFEVASDRLEIRVAHESAGSKDPGPEGELGLLLMQCLMDEVRTEAGGTEHVTWMVKRLQR